MKSYCPSQFFQISACAMLCWAYAAVPCLAGYDLSDPYASAGAGVGVNGQSQLNSTKAPFSQFASAGAGAGLNGQSTRGNTNVQFSDFNKPGDSWTPNIDPRTGQLRSDNPTDLLPINQMQTVNANNTGQLIYDTNQRVALMENHSLSGTSYSQAPRTRGGLQPTTSALQAPFSPGGYTEIPSGQLSFGFNTKGGVIGNAASYQALNYHNSIGLPMLPPTSLGSVDFNIVQTGAQVNRSLINGPANFLP